MEQLAKDWYTDLRGRIHGNTVTWDDLPQYTRLNILDVVGETYETMEEAWQWPETTNVNGSYGSPHLLKERSNHDRNRSTR